jgi:hypothetical protein
VAGDDEETVREVVVVEPPLDRGAEETLEAGDAAAEASEDAGGVDRDRQPVAVGKPCAAS